MTDTTAEHFDPDDARAYRFLADKVIELFNPPDHDVAEEALLADALERAAEFIETRFCTCSRDEACARCEALGRYADQRVER